MIGRAGGRIVVFDVRVGGGDVSGQQGAEDVRGAGLRVNEEVEAVLVADDDIRRPRKAVRNWFYLETGVAWLVRGSPGFVCAWADERLRGRGCGYRAKNEGESCPQDEQHGCDDERSPVASATFE